MLGIFGRVEDVIEHAIGVEIYYSESFNGAVEELITQCLYNDKLTPAEKAEKLLGLSKMEKENLSDTKIQ